MRWVDVPFEIHENTMHTMGTEWPQRCACCAGSPDGGSYQLFGHLQKGESKVMVPFHVPYCTDCTRHAGPVWVVQVVSMIGAFLLWALVGWLMFLNGLGESATGVVLFLLAAVVLVYVAYQIAKRIIATMSTARMKPGCVNNDYAVSVKPDDGKWRLRFESDAYGADFANLNGLPLLLPAASTQ